LVFDAGHVSEPPEIAKTDAFAERVANQRTPTGDPSFEHDTVNMPLIVLVKIAARIVGAAGAREFRDAPFSPSFVMPGRRGR
jgi:hypothetical protein